MRAKRLVLAGLALSFVAFGVACFSAAPAPPGGGATGETAPVSGAQASGSVRAGAPLAQVQPAQASPSPSAAVTPSAGRGEVTRTELYEEAVEIEGVRYRMVTAELVLGPRAETPVHVHPGPSTGYVQSGRITVSVAGGNHTTTYSSGSSIAHPWNVPHTFANTSDETVRMLSFELIPIR